MLHRSGVGERLAHDADVVNAGPIEIDTTDPNLSAVSFADASAKATYSFTPDQAGTTRVSFFPDGTNPTDEQIASGSGATLTLTGVGEAGVAFSGTTAAMAAATYQPTIYYIDEFGEEVWLTYSDVVVTAGGPTQVFEELFGQTNGTQIDSDANWDNLRTLNTARLVVNDGALGMAPLDTLGSQYVKRVEAFENDQYVEFDNGSVGAGTARLLGAMFRCTDADNFYWIRIQGNWLGLLKRVGGASPTVIADIMANTFVEGSKVRAEAEGTTIRVYVDEGSGWVLKGTYTDSAHSAGGIGVYALSNSGVTAASTMTAIRGGNL